MHYTADKPTWWTGISRCLIGGRYTVEGFEDTKRVIRICKSKNRQHNGQKKKTEEQTTQWPKEKDRRTDNTMSKRKRQKNRQHNGQKKKTEEQNTMAKRKRQKNRKHNGQKKKTEEQKTQWPKEKDRTNNDLQNTTHKTMLK